MKKIIMTKGLPGSGKSTWARKVVRTSNSVIKRVNKDDLRSMIDDGVWNKFSESFILRVRDAIVTQALQHGKIVIVDDTNLAPCHETRLREIAEMEGAEFEVKDFTHISVKKCIEQDLMRDKSVGKDVILGMYKKYLRKPAEKIVQDSNLPHAVIFDLDGTLAIMTDRGPFDWDKCGSDELCLEVKRLYEFYIDNNYHVILVSGRDSVCRKETENWLARQGIIAEALYMRPEGDNRKDSEVKLEIFESFIKGKYYVEAVFDDRNQVVELWRSLGLKCFQVADGDF